MTLTWPPPAIPGTAVASEPFPRTMALKWSVLHHAAWVVAVLAGLPGDASGAATMGYPWSCTQPAGGA